MLFRRVNYGAVFLVTRLHPMELKSITEFAIRVDEPENLKALFGKLEY
jgi:hypothetical protein